MPPITTAALPKLFSPSIGPNRCFTLRWSCSTMLCRLPDYAAMNGFRASLHGLQRSLTRHNHRSSPDWQDDRKETDHMTTEDGRPPCLLDGQIEHFLESLRNSGY